MRRLYRTLRFAAKHPAAQDFTQLKSWVRSHPDGHQIGGGEFAWVKRGVLVRTAEWIWRLRHGSPTPMEQGNRRYDILTVEAMRRVVRPDSNCIDIGAATGEMLKYIVALAPDGTHQAFEPVPSQASALRKRFPVVQVHELALSDKTAEVDFFVVKDDGNISALHNPQEIRGLVGDTCISDWQGQVETITVEACTLDDVLGADVGSLDFIKMDVEGAEVAVFRGALRTLAKCGPIVVFECSGENVEELYGATNLFDVLSEVDFSVSTLDGWLAGEGPLWPSEYPSKDTVSGEWNWMYVAHPTH